MVPESTQPDDSGHIDDGENDAAGSGAYSLAGYDYQVDVSLWLALQLHIG